ncbi:MAG: hypothetical protein UU94_C0017G0021, partial [Candidatus Collierbacteria bacterium GW2011_GWB2_42_12]
QLADFIYLVCGIRHVQLLYRLR